MRQALGFVKAGNPGSVNTTSSSSISSSVPQRALISSAAVPELRRAGNLGLRGSLLLTVLGTKLVGLFGPRFNLSFFVCQPQQLRHLLVEAISGR